MLSRICLALALVGPAAAQGQSRADHPATLVDINALTADSDFTIFMDKDVPAEVRRAALRRLWGLMQLPVTCDELCYEAEPAASGFAHVASEQRPIPSQ